MGPPQIFITVVLLTYAVYLADSQTVIRERRQINVHDIPKTSFSCNDKQAGEYYADLEIGCQAYHICLPGLFGKTTKMSFACPNGTLFSQATRVCSPIEKVYCPLATRFYDNLHGALDTDKDDYEKSRASPITNFNALHHQRRPIQAVPETSISDYADEDYDAAPPPPPPTTRAPASRRGQGTASRRFQPQQASPTPRTTPRTTQRPTFRTTTQAPTNRPAPTFRSPFRIPGSVALRGPQTAVQAEIPTAVQPQAVRPVQSSGTPPVRPPPVPFNSFAVSGTPPLAQPVIPANAVPSGTPPAGPPPIPANAFSSGTPPLIQPPIPSNAFAIGSSQVVRPAQTAFRFPQRPQIRRPGPLSGSTTTSTTTTTTEEPLVEYEYYDYEEDPKASTQAPTPTRTKRAIAVKEILSPIPDPRIPPKTSFTCQDKVGGGVYADLEAACELFHICVPIGKGKLLDYGLLCDNGTAFNQETGACEPTDSFTCNRGRRFAKKDKIRMYLSGQKPWKTSKSGKRKIREVEAEKDYAIQDYPLTSFSCENRTIGGYYADLDVDCQMFHICTNGPDGRAIDMRFLCTNGTIFNQKLLICQNEELVACDDGPEFYENEFTKFLERERTRAAEEENIQKEADEVELLKYAKKGDAKRRKKASGFVKIAKTL